MCPITQDVMQDPVTGMDGQTYEKAALLAHFASGARTSPASGEELDAAAFLPSGEPVLFPNLTLAKMLCSRKAER